jgi:hypothetical protein
VPGGTASITAFLRASCSSCNIYRDVRSQILSLAEPMGENSVEVPGQSILALASDEDDDAIVEGADQQECAQVCE